MRLDQRASPRRRHVAVVRFAIMCAVAALVLPVSGPALAQYTPGCVIVAISATQLGCSQKMTEDAIGVGVGTATPSGQVDSHVTFTNLSGEINNVFLLTLLAPPTDSSASFHAVHSHLDVPTGTNANFSGVLTDGLFDPHYYGSGHVNAFEALQGSASFFSGSAMYLRGVYGVADNEGGTVVEAAALTAQVQTRAPGATYNAYGLHVNGAGAQTGIFNYYGVRVEHGAGLNPISFYADSDPAYFGGGFTIQGDIIRPLEPNGYACWSGGRLVSSSVPC